VQTISKLSGECKKCPHVNDCDDKRMVACAMAEMPQQAMKESMAPVMAPVMQPMLRISHPITINMGEYGTIETSIEEMTEKLKKDLYKNLNCSFNK
jgi:hypothetical protein